MKKRLISVFLLTVFILASLLVPASAKISNIQISSTSDGNVRVRWNDSSSSSNYDIKYRLDDWKPNYNYYQSTKSTTAILTHLIPGQRYKITVDTGSASDYEYYTVPYGVFKEYSTGNYLRLTQTSFSISDLQDRPNSTFDVRVYWPRLKYNRDYAAKLVLKTPLGYCGRVVSWDSFTFENQYAYRYMTYSMMTDWLNDVEDDYKEIPTGRYQFQFYVDGLLYDIANFNVYR